MPETTIMATMPPFHSLSVHIGLGQGRTHYLLDHCSPTQRKSIPHLDCTPADMDSPLDCTARLPREREIRLRTVDQSNMARSVWSIVRTQVSGHGKALRAIGWEGRDHRARAVVGHVAIW